MKIYEAESSEVTTITPNPKLERIYAQLLGQIGEDLARQGLQKTPQRASEAFQFLTQGYNQTIDEVLNEAIFDEEYDEMVIVKNIEFYSACEHHLLPFLGRVSRWLHSPKKDYRSQQNPTHRRYVLPQTSGSRKADAAGCVGVGRSTQSARCRCRHRGSTHVCDVSWCTKATPDYDD